MSPSDQRSLLTPVATEESQACCRCRPFKKSSIFLKDLKVDFDFELVDYGIAMESEMTRRI